MTDRTDLNATGRACTVTVCRDCCCGSADKHPTVDHDAQLAALRAAAAGRHRVRVSECLDVCDRSNVVVINPSPAARRAGARVVHLAEVLDDVTATAVADWLDAGGPGSAPVPVALRDHLFRPPKGRG
jgi:hypothetical protein